MKISAIILFLLIPIVAVAQDYQGMNKEAMQEMMRQMQKMQTCMQNIDQAKLKALEQRSYEFDAEIKSLCADGKRSEAQEKAMSFSKKMMKDPTMKTMRKCGEKMKGKMPKMPFMDQDQDQDHSSRHVCD